jgi:hypothetical protein
VDIFAAGTLFYGLLTGMRTLPGGAHRGAEHAPVERIQYPSQTNAELVEFDALCARATSIRPQDRYSTAREFCDAIRRCYDSAFGSAPPDLVSNETVVSIYLASLRGDSRRKRTRAIKHKTPSPESAMLPDGIDTKASCEEVSGRAQGRADAQNNVIADASATGSETAFPGHSARRYVEVGISKAGAQLKGEPQSALAAAPSRSRVASINSRLEEMLGKQPANLAEYLRQTPRALSEVIFGFVSAAEALALRHAEKSKCIGLTPEGVCFDGMGKASIRASATTIPGATMAGALGNPRYSAPELFGDNSDATGYPPVASDIYSLGFMFYELLLGKTLFQQTFAGQHSDLDWLRWHTDTKTKAPTLRDLFPGSSAGLSELIDAMIAKKPEARLSDINAVVTRLRSLAQQAQGTIISVQLAKDISQPAPPSTNNLPKKRTQRRASLVVAQIIVVALLLWQAPHIYRDLLVPLCGYFVQFIQSYTQ